MWARGLFGLSHGEEPNEFLKGTLKVFAVIIFFENTFFQPIEMSAFLSS